MEIYFQPLKVCIARINSGLFYFMENSLNLVIASYSVDQKLFHIEYMHEYLQHTYKSIKQNKNPHYNMIGVFKNFQDAHKYIDLFEKKFNIK